MRLIRWIRNLFAPNPQPAPVPTEPVPTHEGQRVALVVGHTATARGARSVIGIQEYDYFKEVCEIVLAELKTDKVKMFLRDGRGIAQTIDAAANWGADVIIELHFNAFNGTAHGAEILIPQGTTNALGADFLAKWCEFAKLRNRGVKTVTRTQPGGTSVFTINARKRQGFLWETFFGDTISDFRDQETVAEFLCEWIRERL